MNGWHRVGALAFAAIGLAAAIGGCRDLVAPGAEALRPGGRLLEGTIAFDDGREVGEAGLILSSQAYVETSPLLLTGQLAADGSFSLALPPRFSGLFDLRVERAGGAGLAATTFLGLRASDVALDLVWETVPIEGRWELPEMLPGRDTAEVALQLVRSRPRPAGANSFSDFAFPATDDQGAVLDRVTAGSWRVELELLGSSEHELFRLQREEPFGGGTMVFAPELVPITLRPLWPEGLAERPGARFGLEDERATLRTRRRTAEDGAFVLWAPPRRLDLAVEWDEAFAVEYWSPRPGLTNSDLDLQNQRAFDLVLPPRVLRLVALDGGVPASAAVCDADPPGFGPRRLLEFGPDGRSTFLCSSTTWELEFWLDGRTIERSVIVGDEDVVVVVDFAQDATVSPGGAGVAPSGNAVD